MEYHTIYGISCLEKGWVPSPSYMLRRDRALKLINNLRSGRVLEIGCGAGGLIYDIAQKGFSCVAVETSDKARNIAKHINGDQKNVKILPKIDPNWKNEFDYVFSFEVLEHIEDDNAALRQWYKLLKPGGEMIISVPSDPDRWNQSDVWAGHFRRYTRQQLVDKLENVDLKLEYIENYGYPLANIIEPIRAFFHGRQLLKEKKQQSAKNQQCENTSRSGVQRNIETRLYPYLSSKVGVYFMKIFFYLQGAFASKELGAGIMTVSRKKG